MSLSGPPWRYAIDRPSGLHAGRLSVSGSLSGPSNSVSWRVVVLHDQCDPLPIGCPHVVIHIALQGGGLAPLAALAVEQPELGVLVVAAREEREPSPVGAPTRRVLTRFRGGQADVARAVPV